jgi:hypothetical protein
MGAVSQIHLEGPQQQLNLYDRIRDNISRLTAILSDMNALAPNTHRESNFSELYEQIDKRMKDGGGEATATPSKQGKTGKKSSGGVSIGTVEGNVITSPSGPVHIGNTITATEYVAGDKISVGNISNSTGVAIGRGAQAHVEQHSGVSTDEIAKIFAMLQQQVEKMPPGEEKDETKDSLDKLQKEAGKGEEADESRVRKYMNFLAETAPDIWEVARNSFINPVLGLGTVFRKVMEYSKKHGE